MEKSKIINFKSKSNLVHKNFYDYSLVEFNGTANKVTIICPIHGEFSQRANDHMNGRGCRTCGIKAQNISNIKSRLEKKFKSIIQPDEHKIIPLGNGKFTIVDNEDFDELKKINWAFKKEGYAVNSTVGKMHRIITKAPEGLVVDHINGNGLDNRRCNLRICTPLENSRNLKKTSSKTSSYLKGVSFNKNSQKWVSYIRGEYIGLFNTEEEAGKAYDLKAIEYYGDFAKLNFPR